MRILWFTNTPSSIYEQGDKSKTIFGGWISALEQEIAKNDEVELFIAFKSGIGKDIKISQRFNVTYYSIPTKHSTFKLINKAYRINHLNYYKKIIDEIKPQIIQVFGTENNFGLIRKITEIPIVIHIQSILNIYNYKFFSGISWFDYLCNDIFGLYKILRNKIAMNRLASIESEIYSLNCNFLGRTKWDMRVSSVLSKDSHYYHCDEVLRHEFYDVDLILLEEIENLNILTTMSGGIYKGLEVVFITASLLKPRIEFKWNIAGINPDNPVVKLLEKKFHNKHKELNIEFLGVKEASQLVELFGKTDIFIHPSHIDNSPNSLCEAMLAGLPVVSTNCGGIPSIIRDHYDGVLVQDGDPWALAGVVIDSFRNYSKYRAMGLNAKKAAMLRHDKRKIVNDLLSIYKEIIGNNVGKICN